MPKAYSYDLWVRVVDSVVKDGLSCRESAQRYHLVPSTVIRWVSHYRHSGSYEPRGTGRPRPSAYSPIMIVLSCT